MAEAFGKAERICIYFDLVWCGRSHIQSLFHNCVVDMCLLDFKLKENDSNLKVET